jgi:membrane protein implicated in regulation of membrane protease activity
MSRWITLFTATMAGALAIGAIAALATGNWLFLIWALCAHLVASTALLLYVATTSPRRPEPDPAELARREQERLAELRRRGEQIARAQGQPRPR